MSSFANIGSSTILSTAFLGIKLISGNTVTEYDTITEALANAISGDVVSIGPGTYSESITIPNGVSISGPSGNSGDAIINGTSATGTRVTLGVNSRLSNVTVVLPTNNVAAISSNIVGHCILYNIGLQGNGGTGIGIQSVGAATTIVVITVIYLQGTSQTVIQADAGKINASNIIIQTGVLTNGLLVQNNGECIFNFFNIHALATVTDGINADAGIIIGSNYECELATNGIHITSDSSDVQLRNGRISSATFDVLVDDGLSDGIFYLAGFELLNNKLSYPPEWIEGADVLLTTQDATPGDPGFRVTGELHVGTFNKGYESVFGEGDSYTTGMVVLTTDNTAGAAADGGNFNDVSAEAASFVNSTFSFQGVGINHTILFCSTQESSTDYLKYWGVKIKNTTAGSTDGVWAFEIWDGAAWVAINIMATHADLFYRYADALFIRANSLEHIRFGIDTNTTWASKTINGTTGYWCRIRITTQPTTNPVFEQFKLSTSRTEINSDGTITYHGNARFKRTIVITGNIFGESGGVIDALVPVGSGGSPTGWTHTIKNSALNNNNDAIYLQFVLPRGISTDLPLEFEMNYITTADTGDIDLTLSVLPIASSGVEVADPAGGLVPTQRTQANTPTLTANAAQTHSFTLTNTNINKLHHVDIAGFDISSYYEEDGVFIRLILDDDGAGNSDLYVTSLEITGYFWTNGEKF